jgi:hypothetical protein
MALRRGKNASARVGRRLLRICSRAFWTEHRTFEGIGASIPRRGSEHFVWQTETPQMQGEPQNR